MALFSSQMQEQNQTKVSWSEMQHVSLMSCNVVLFLVKEGKVFETQKFPQLCWYFHSIGTLVSELISKLKHEGAVV